MKAGSASSYIKCYEGHKALKVGDFVIYGGSASWPVVKDADIYVSLQSGSTCGCLSDPWDDKGQVIEVHFSIPDGSAPTDVTRFKKMIDWLCNQLQLGKKIHVGCVGGHGRTGLVLAAIVSQMTGEKDAIHYVRQHYCSKVVESSSQIAFLVKNYGIKISIPSKGDTVRDHREQFQNDWAAYGVVPTQKSFGFSSTRYRDEELIVKSNGKPEPKMKKGTKTLHPVPSARCVWKEKKT